MMKHKYIKELATEKMNVDGYDYFVSLVKYYMNKYEWPKLIIDESVKTKEWADEEVLSFTQQFLTYVLNENKLKNYKVIPENYLSYYFKTILVSYLADKIKDYPNRKDLSLEISHQISLETHKIRQEQVLGGVNKIINKISKKDIPIYFDFYFSKSDNSLSFLAEKYNLPISEVHSKILQFKNIISTSFSPITEDEGVWFIEKLHKQLENLNKS